MKSLINLTTFVVLSLLSLSIFTMTGYNVQIEQ